MKKIFGFAAVIAMVAVANVRMSSSNNEELTALQLENVEYWAEAESGLGMVCKYVEIGGFYGCAYSFTGIYCADFGCRQ